MNTVILLVSGETFEYETFGEAKAKFMELSEKCKMCMIVDSNGNAWR